MSNMARSRSSAQICYSAGKVTASLLLSFLAISSTSTTLAAAQAKSRQDISAQIPFLPPSVSPESEHAADQQEDTLQFVSTQGQEEVEVSFRQPCTDDG